MKKSRLRLFMLGAVVWLIFTLFVFRLIQVQIVDGESYLEKQQAGSSKIQVIKAARGEIVDRKGRPFSRNNASYDLIFDRALAPGGSENKNIYTLIKILRYTGEKWIDNLPLEIKAGKAVFSGDEDDIAKLRKHLDTNIYTSAEDVFYWLKDRYGLEEYSAADARDIAAVRYEMEREGYSMAVRYTFARDISLDTAVFIRQMSDEVLGVEVAETAKRVYIDGDLAPHIVGRVGAIFADEMDSYLSQGRGYTREDFVGKEGIEKAYESQLRGADGVRRIDLDANYRVMAIEEEQAAVPGNTVVLTIDKDIQRTARDALVKEIKYLNETAKAGEGKEANAGAVVAVDIKNSEILAAVTYPSYDLTSFSADYAENAADPLYPFLNRAFSGVYAPGSCFKPVVGTAGIAEGLMTRHNHVNCQQVYTHFATYQPTCLGFHGLMTVSDALRASCNIYFYDVGRQLGISRINEYARAMGLGVPTGIELSESKGTQCDPDTNQEGDVLQAAIGQLDNGYTPVQLANYCATIARRGVRKDLSLVKSVSSYYDWQQVIEQRRPVAETKLDVDPSVFDPIIDGMIEAAHAYNGTAFRYLGDYPLTVACKTGTPQTSEFPNSTFICFAPADDPQIAVAVVIEKGWHGYTGAPVAREVMDAFFFPDREQTETADPAELPDDADPNRQAAPAVTSPEQPQPAAPQVPSHSLQPESVPSLVLPQQPQQIKPTEPEPEPQQPKTSSGVVRRDDGIMISDNVKTYEVVISPPKSYVVVE